MAEGRRGEEMATGNNAAAAHSAVTFDKQNRTEGRPVIRVNKRFKKNRESSVLEYMFGMGGLRERKRKVCLGCGEVFG